MKFIRENGSISVFSKKSGLYDLRIGPVTISDLDAADMSEIADAITNRLYNQTIEELQEKLSEMEDK